MTRVSTAASLKQNNSSCKTKRIDNLLSPKVVPASTSFCSGRHSGVISRPFRTPLRVFLRPLRTPLRVFLRPFRTLLRVISRPFKMPLRVISRPFRTQNNGRSPDNDRPKMPLDWSLFYLTGHFDRPHLYAFR